MDIYRIIEEHRDRLMTQLNARTAKEGECLVYTGSRIKKGYGCIYIYYQKKHVYTHRLAWILENGRIPDGLWVLHKCDNPPCVNIKHLYLGDVRDNARDMIERNRCGYLNYPERWVKGSTHPNAKLTEAQVEDILKTYDGTKNSRRDLAALYGVGYTTIWQITRGLLWAHVQKTRDVMGAK